MSNRFHYAPWTLVLVVAVALGAAAWLHAEGSGSKDIVLKDVDLMGDGGSAQLVDPDLVEMAVVAAQEDGAVDDEAGSDPSEGDVDKRYHDALAKADKNSDGKLDKDERAVAHSYMREFRRPGVEKKLQSGADSNGDGKVDDTEKAQLKISIERRLTEIENTRARIALKWDDNHDQHLDKSDRDKLRDAWLKHLDYLSKKAKADKADAAQAKVDRDKAAKDIADQAAADKKALDAAKKALKDAKKKKK